MKACFDPQITLRVVFNDEFLFAETLVSLLTAKTRKWQVILPFPNFTTETGKNASTTSNTYNYKQDNVSNR